VHSNISTLNSEISQSKVKLIQLLQQIEKLSKLRNEIGLNNDSINKKFHETTQKMEQTRFDIDQMKSQKDILREEIKK